MTTLGEAKPVKGANLWIIPSNSCNKLGEPNSFSSKDLSEYPINKFKGLPILFGHGEYDNKQNHGYLESVWLENNPDEGGKKCIRGYCIFDPNAYVKTTEGKVAGLLGDLIPNVISHCSLAFKYLPEDYQNLKEVELDHLGLTTADAAKFPSCKIMSCCSEDMDKISEKEKTEVLKKSSQFIPRFPKIVQQNKNSSNMATSEHKPASVSTLTEEEKKKINGELSTASSSNTHVLLSQLNHAHEKLLNNHEDLTTKYTTLSTENETLKRKYQELETKDTERQAVLKRFIDRKAAKKIEAHQKDYAVFLQEDNGMDEKEAMTAAEQHIREAAADPTQLNFIVSVAKKTRRVKELEAQNTQRDQQQQQSELISKVSGTMKRNVASNSLTNTLAQSLKQETSATTPSRKFPVPPGMGQIRVNKNHKVIAVNSEDMDNNPQEERGYQLDDTLRKALLSVKSNNNGAYFKFNSK